MNNQTAIELLAPAKNVEYGQVAIRYGADAVYIGASKFGARSSAGNSLADIEKLCRYAHLFNAKVYATINTILYENELPLARKLVYGLYDAGIDAIIIQDVALLMMDLPPLRIFASTQMHNYELEKIKFFEKIGIDRFILARELSLNQIKEIRKNTRAELEFFVHGALCVSLSGRCYASAHATGFSGNRGECKQICRLKYDLLDDKGNTIISQKHLLSLKDLSLADYLEKLIDAGISSFKIEGRLKDINYVKNITAYYRKKIDELLSNKHNYKKSSQGNVYLAFEPKPERSFNRGFTTYFIDENNPSSLANFETPKSIGQFIGLVSDIKQNKIKVQTTEQIHSADGLCFYDGHNLVGFLVNKVENNWINPNKKLKFKIGTKLYRNQDYEFEKLLAKDETVRKLPIDIHIRINQNKLLAKATFGEISVEQLADFEYSCNIKQLKIIENQLKKTNNTVFEVNNVFLNINQPVFLKLSEINSLRRELLEKLESKILSSYKRFASKINQISEKYPFEQLDYMENISNSLAEKFYLTYGANIRQKAFELIDDKRNKVVMITKYCLKKEIGECPKDGFNNKYIKKYVLRNKFSAYELEFDCINCFMKLRTTD